jgi:hypothetical protein
VLKVIVKIMGIYICSDNIYYDNNGDMYM